MNGLIEIRLHGRGGQGVVSAATGIAETAFLEGRSVQSFGLFGAERRGAPVAAFARVGSKPLMPRCQILQPDMVVVFDTSLALETVASGLKKDGVLLVNCSVDNSRRDRYRALGFHVWFVDATEIALRNGLGGVGIPIINTAMLGAIARLGLYSMASLEKVIAKKLPQVIEKNIAAARNGYEKVEEYSIHATA